MESFFTKLKMKIRGEIPTSTLINNGMKVGKNFHRTNGVQFDVGFCWLIEIGDNVAIGTRVDIIAHDASTKLYLDKSKIGKVIIGNNVFIGAKSTILPNVRIGNDVIIGAGSVVTKDIPTNCLAFGNPCNVVRHIK